MPQHQLAYGWGDEVVLLVTDNGFLSTPEYTPTPCWAGTRTSMCIHTYMYMYVCRLKFCSPVSALSHVSPTPSLPPSLLPSPPPLVSSLPSPRMFSSSMEHLKPNESKRNACQSLQSSSSEDTFTLYTCTCTVNMYTCTCTYMNGQLAKGKSEGWV